LADNRLGLGLWLLLIDVEILVSIAPRLFVGNEAIDPFSERVRVWKILAGNLAEEALALEADLEGSRLRLLAREVFVLLN